MSKAIPIFRIFDYEKALEHYVGWMGFKIDWEYKPEGSPKYLQISLGTLSLHLTEHHGDCTPGSRVYVENFPDLPAYHAQLLAREYKFSRPGLETPFYDENLWEVTTGDPFGNRLTLTSPK